MKKMGAADLQQQMWLIRAALSTLSTEDNTSQLRYSPPTEHQPAVSPEALIAAADAIAARLDALAVTDDREASWIGLGISGDNWTLNPLGLDLYSGIPGVILFLAYLDNLMGEGRYERLARKALNALQSEKASTQHWLKLIGGFSGWGGMIYTLAHLGVLWNEPALLDEAETIAAALSPLIEQDPYFDVIAGSAGCIMALSSLYRSRPSPQLLALAVQAGDHLLKQARPQTHGLGWQGVFQREAALTGFSHGTAGIAWALLNLAAWSGEARFKETALSALAYERSLFSSDAGNWPDLRPLPPGQSPFRTAWCHGAPGIGLARLDSLRYLDDEITRQEIAAAVGATLTHGFGRNHSLCHGDLGNIELILRAGTKLNHPDWQEDARRQVAVTLADLSENGPVCGVPWGMETPGLMNGLAGIGYGLLRLAAPERIPSVLLLEPPPQG
jgi:type 2 lantibiotic biosynthesis protein LanM